VPRAILQSSTASESARVLAGGAKSILNIDNLVKLETAIKSAYIS